MKANELLRWVEARQRAIEELVVQLEQIQVAFNAQFDTFKAQHDARLDELTEQVFDRQRGRTAGSVSAGLAAAIDERLPAERTRLEERLQKLQSGYLPQRRQAADEILTGAQAEMAALRSLNPELDRREEELKAQRAELEAELAARNDEIRSRSRGLGVVTHFLTITRADRERQRIIGKLELLNGSLLKVRQDWEKEREKVVGHQAEMQKQWQMESIAVARLQAELDQLADDQAREDLALRRAARDLLDSLKAAGNLKAPVPGSDPALETGLQAMITLNIQTDDYHDGLAGVSGLMGLLGGIGSGLAAIAKSVEGLQREQEMHASYLKPLEFKLADAVEAFHEQWPALNDQFADETAIGTHPVEFSTSLAPLLAGPLSQAGIEAMFDELGAMIEQAAAAW